MTEALTEIDKRCRGAPTWSDRVAESGDLFAPVLSVVQPLPG